MSVPIFEALFLPSTDTERRVGGPDRRRATANRRYEPPELGSVSVPAAAPENVEAQAAAVEPAALTFSEAELARACAAAAAAARREAIALDAQQQHAAEERLQGSLRASLALLEAEAAEREQRSRALVRELTGAVLEAVLMDNSAVRAEVILVALQECLADMPGAKDLLIRTAPGECQVIAARLLPPLDDPVAAATTRVIADTTLSPGEVRLAWRDSWIELDVPRWLAQVRERLDRAIFGGTSE